MRRFGVCAATLLAAGGLAACGGGDGDATTTTATEATVVPGPAATAEVPDDTTDGEVSATSPLNGCERLPESGDGVYTIADAGEIEIESDGSTVGLVEARPADGWTATGDTEDDDDEVEVYFRSGDREIEFEAELDDGRLEVDICED